MKNQVANYFIPIILILAIGYAGAYFAGREFAPPIGGLIGAAVGILISVYDTIKTPLNLRRRRFTAYVGSGKYGSSFVHDSRLVLIMGLAVFCALSSFIWQIIFIVIKNNP